MQRQRELLLSQACRCQDSGWVVNGPAKRGGKGPQHPLCVFAQAAKANGNIKGQDGRSSYSSDIFSTYYSVE